jgi:hypothetical protein
MSTDIWTEVDTLEVNNLPYLREYELDMSSYTISTYYQVKLTVDNSVGTAESDSNVFLLAELPGKPSAPTRVSDGEQITIIMTEPTTDGGSQITNYEL